MPRPANTTATSICMMNNTPPDRPSVILMQWKPVFAWIPVETIVKEHQQDYYDAIAQSDHDANSAPFITFMLHCLLQALKEMQESNQKSNQKSN